MGHARALVGVKDEDNQLDVYRQITKQNLSVREVEDLLREGKEKNKDDTKQKEEKKDKPTVSSEQKSFTSDFSDKVAAKVQIKKQPSGNGKMIINFNSEVDLNRIIEILNE